MCVDMYMNMKPILVRAKTGLNYACLASAPSHGSLPKLLFICITVVNGTSIISIFFALIVELRMSFLKKNILMESPLLCPDNWFHCYIGPRFTAKAFSLLQLPVL